MRKQVLVMFGGISPEHEVSIITGLQVMESIDRSEYDPIAIYLDKKGVPFLFSDLKTRLGFLSPNKKKITFGKDEKGGFIQVAGAFGSKYYPYSAYLAFHGGEGESGSVQGLLQVAGIPYTSSSMESSVITMNKSLTKDELREGEIVTVPGVSLFATDILTNSVDQKALLEKLSLPVIIKPVHLGSSIGIKVARTEVELEKYLLEAAHIDNEILIEKYLSNFMEYNCSVRLINGRLEASEIERPMSKDEILSFADKYQRGAKKTGGDSGMASLQRELPAKIPLELRDKIQATAKSAFIACRCKGMVRIDFMFTSDKTLYLTEINPIPGSMSFYLWEASGIQFKQQITDLIEQSIVDHNQHTSMSLDYESDIVDKFIHST